MSNVAARNLRSFVMALAVVSLAIAATGCGTARMPGGRASASGTGQVTDAHATAAAQATEPASAPSATAFVAVETADSSPSATPARPTAAAASTSPDPVDGWLSQVDDLLQGAGQEIQQSDQAEQSGE